ncbi:hypothetical protein HYU06_04295 [Candidatus Woesearchaeota archaeon]|nr:hypothetical protein [Candidatus Woesearchaeota archaeon]
MGFKNRIRGIGREPLFPELGGNAGTITIGIPPEPSYDDKYDDKNDLLEDYVESHYDALTDEQEISTLHNPYPKITSPEQYQTSLEKAIESIEDNWINMFFEEVKDKRGRSQIKSNGTFLSSDVFYLSMYGAARKLTLLALSPQFKEDSQYLTVFNKFTDKINETLDAIVKILPQQYKDLWRAEAYLLNAYKVLSEQLPAEKSSDKYETEFLEALANSRQYVEAYKEFLAMPVKIKQRVLSAYHEKEQGAGFAIAKYLLELAQTGYNDQRATYKHLKPNIIQVLSNLREDMAKLGADAVEEFDAQIKRYNVGFKKAS